MVIAATADDLASGPMSDDAGANTTVEFRPADPTKRETLAALCAEGFDHVIVLCSDVLPPQRADARTLVTLINLRDIEAEGGATSRSPARCSTSAIGPWPRSPGPTTSSSATGW